MPFTSSPCRRRARIRRPALGTSLPGDPSHRGCPRTAPNRGSARRNPAAQRRWSCRRSPAGVPSVPQRPLQRHTRERPERMPSSRVSRRAQCTASSLLTCSTASTSDRSSTSGTKPAPLPWILCKPGSSSSPASICVSTGQAVGSTAIDRIALPLVLLMKRATPVIVPPAPTPDTRMSMAPFVSSQISGPVVVSWIAGLAGFLNCCSSTYFRSLAAMSSALATAPFMFLAPSVSTSLAP